MTKELTREVSGFYLSSHCEVWWIAESVLNMSRSRADGTMSSWLLYFINFTNFHTVSYIIRTPLWTKCASAAAILSNISADENLGVFQDSKFLTEREILLTARTTRELCGLELETCIITHQTWFCISVCSIGKHVLSIGDSHDGCTSLSVTWYRPVPVYPGDSNCVDVVYVTAERTTVSCNATIACSEDKDWPFATATLNLKNIQ